jgi:hypothetical protein
MKRRKEGIMRATKSKRKTTKNRSRKDRVVRLSSREVFTWLSRHGACDQARAWFSRQKTPYKAWMKCNQSYLRWVAGVVLSYDRYQDLLRKSFNAADRKCSNHHKFNAVRSSELRKRLPWKTVARFIKRELKGLE